MKGCVVDETQMPVGFASVAIACDSTFLSGTLTNENGEFVLQLAKSEKQYQLSVSFIGKKTKQISFVANTKNITLDTIVLENNAYQLDEVQISAEQT
ncbi:MAG: carboxypeptidase-like regulatory domain-containing protein, partial [Bacteroidales bacterium]|nr:carboxypeptidase-like regulatory domain-containing protein [Bacteroidales bacterium]